LCAECRKNGLLIVVVGERYDTIVFMPGRVGYNTSVSLPPHRTLSVALLSHARDTVLIFPTPETDNTNCLRGSLIIFPRSSLNQNSDSKGLPSPISPIQSYFFTQFSASISSHLVQTFNNGFPPSFHADPACFQTSPCCKSSGSQQELYRRKLFPFVTIQPQVSPL